MRPMAERTRWIGLLTIVGLAACGGEQAEQEGADMAMSGMDDAMDADTVALAPKNESGITGTVAILESGDSVTVTVTVEGAEPGTSLPSHVHAGNCDMPAGVEAPLTAVAVGDDGSGTATTTVAASLVAGDDMDDADGMEDEQMGEMEHDEDPLVVQVHLPDGTPAACGELS